MLRKIGFQLILSFFLFSFFNVQGSHILGSNIEWTFINSDTIKFDFKFYRDCNGVKQGDFDATLFSGSRFIDSLDFKLMNTEDVTPVCKSSCTQCSNSGCSFKYGVQENTFTAIWPIDSMWRDSGFCEIVLGIYLVDRATSLTSVSSTADFYTDCMLNICGNKLTNSPTSTSNLVHLLCLGQNALLPTALQNFSQNQIGYDSLRYHLVSPKIRKTVDVLYQGGYDYENPLYYLGFPNTNGRLPRGFHNNSENGLIQFRPMKTEVSIFVQKVVWYKNGEVAGWVNRENAVFVLKCPSNNPPYLSGVNCTSSSPQNYTTSACKGDKIIFDVCGRDNDKNDSLNLEALGLPESAKFYLLDSNASRPRGRVELIIDSTIWDQKKFQFFVKVQDNSCPVPSASGAQYTVQIIDKSTARAEIETSIIDTSCGTARLNISVKDSIPHARIYWYVNDTLIANTDTTLHSFSSLDSQLVRVDISRGNCIYSFYDTIVPSSASPIKIGQIKDVDLCENEFYSKFIDVESKNGIDNFTWSYFSNGQLAFKDSSRKVSFKPTSSGIGSIILSAIDSGGCTLAKNVNVNVRSNHFIALHKDTSLCTSTDFVVKLDTISTFNKGWYVDSNFIGNSFSSKDYKPGKYEVWTSSKVKNYCWYSSFNLAFTPQPNLVVPPSIQTCLKHVPIELQSNYKNTMWVGDQIINDSFFLDNSGVKYIDTVKAKYESVAGCKDSALMTIYNGYDTSSIKMPSLIDVCYSTDTFLNIGNVDSGYWSTGKYFFSRITDSTYKVLTKVLQVGNQKAVFEGVTKKGCIDTRSVILSRKNKIDFSVRAANNVVCMDTTSLFSKPSTKRWSGYGVLDSASKYYFKPNGKSGLFTLKAVYWEKGCSASDSLQIKVKEDIRLKKTDFQPKVCLGDTVFFEYPIGNDGYWYDMNKYSSVNSAVGYVVPKKRDTILQRFRYHLPTTKLREKYCNNLDTIRFTPMPYPKVYMDDTLAFCDIDSLVKLKGNPAQVSWFGSIVYPKDDEYLVNPRFIINGVSYANLNKTNANGCTTKKRVFLAKRPTPVVVADSDTSICVDESGYIYNFKNTNGKWSGKYLNGLTSIKLDYNYPLGSYKYVLQKSNKFNCVARDEFILEMGRSYDTNISADTTWGEAPLEVEFTSDLNYAKNLIWYFGNGDSALNTLNTNYTYNQVGKFSVSLIVSDSLNICKTRTVKSNMITVVKSNSILDNGDISVELYPNPSKGSFLLINQTSKVIDAKVYNTDGQLIETMGEIKDEILFGEEYQTGTYILKILDGDGSERVFSLIKL